MNILFLCRISSCFVMFLHPAVDGEQGGWGVARGGEEAGAPGWAGQLQGGQLSRPHRHLHQAHPGQSSEGGGGCYPYVSGISPRGLADPEPQDWS